MLLSRPRRPRYPFRCSTSRARTTGSATRSTRRWPRSAARARSCTARPARKLEAAMAEYCGTEHAVGCASGSDALLLALMALGIGPGDEVIVPSFTFFATASAVWRLGAKPVFADIVPETFNLDPADVLGKITHGDQGDHPGAPVRPVCRDGRDPADRRRRPAAFRSSKMPARRSAPSIDGRRAGSLGTCGCFSFYPTKNLGGFGDGGLITTNDGELAAKLRVLRDHGQQPRYYHHFVGINSRLDTLQAAVLSVKLPHLDEWAAARERHADRYASGIRPPRPGRRRSSRRRWPTVAATCGINTRSA